MASTVASRPNHYELLGVAPGASQEEITRAFAGRMFAPRPMADAAQVGIAYEVLRNPAKRKAYDDALGLNQPPTARPLPAAVSFRISTRVIGSAADPQVETRTATGVPAERGVGSFIAQSLRPPAAEAPRPRPEPEAISPRAAPPMAPPPPPVMAPPLASLPDDEAGESGFNRTALAVGGMVLAMVLVGAWAGLEAGDPGEAEAAKPALSAALPRPKPAADAPIAAEPVAPRAEPVTFAALRTRHARPQAPRPRASADRLAEVSQSLRHSYYETTGADGTPEIAVADAPAPAVAEAAAPTVTAASLPLSNRTVARTIERIGYRCGEVVATSPVEGQASGVFKVTCSSGQSYQAKPVKGRYRFGRWKGD